MDIRSLDREMFEEAKKMMQLCVFGEPMKVQFDLEMFPPPLEEGAVIYGYSSREYRAVMMDGNLQWEFTGGYLWGVADGYTKTDS